MAKSYDPTETPATKMRRPHLAKDDEWIREFLGRVQTGHIATQWDGQPFITPTNFWYDPERHEIYFHSNITGRIRANIEHESRVCFEAFEAGKMLPSNLALEFSTQFESVVVFGTARILEVLEEQRRALYGLISRYFPHMSPGEHYRPITDQELKRTSVYAITIEGWTGKRNWKELAVQDPDWPALPEEWLK
jgi:uncharacterized protein